MTGSIPWDILTSQYLSYGAKRKEELYQLIHSPEIDVRYSSKQSIFGFHHFLL